VAASDRARHHRPGAGRRQPEEGEEAWHHGAIVNNKSQLDRIQTYIDDARAKLPSTSEVRNSVPGQ